MKSELQKKILKNARISVSYLVLSIVCSILSWIFNGHLITSSYFGLMCVIYAIKNQNLIKQYHSEGDYKRVQLFQLKSTCYKIAKPLKNIRGIVLRCTSQHEPNIDHYITNQTKYGDQSNTNASNNCTNRLFPHAFIGYDKNEEIVIAETVSQSISCWQSGNGINGSYDTDPNGHLQIEICTNFTDDKLYFNDVIFGAAVQYCGHLCEKYSLSSETIVSGKETYASGYAQNDNDLESWLEIYGYTMDDFRYEVKKWMNEKKYGSLLWMIKLRKTD